MNRFIRLFLPLLLASPLACAATLVDNLNLPDGFAIEVYAKDVKNARQMAMGADGTIFVGSRGAGVVSALVDADKDGDIDEVVTVATGLNMPSGIAIKGNDLYVAAVSEVVKYADIEKTFRNKPKGEVVINDLPSDRHHGWKYIDFGPDGRLYVPVGTPCNICQTKGGDKFDDERYDSILAYDLNTGKREWIARGVRNTVGFDWHPTTKELWFSDNGRDWLGDNLPPCEINRVSKAGEHFGYPYVHGGYVIDPEFGNGKSADDFTKPAYNLGAHVAPLGIHFYRGAMFPDKYQGQLLVTEHGSWNRTNKVGYRIMVAMLEGNEVKSYLPLVTGFLDPVSQEVSGRPVAFLPMEDGSVLVSDDFADVVYRVSYSGSSSQTAP